jgi:ribosomal protein S15P/S13E
MAGRSQVPVDAARRGASIFNASGLRLRPSETPEGVVMTDAPKNPGLDGRARDKSGQIDHKHPTTKIKHLREHYGKHFAPDWDGERTLGELLKESKFESLTQYVKHHGHQPVSES